MQAKSAVTLPDATRHFDDLPDSAYVRKPTVRAILGISSSTIDRRVRAGLLPEPKSLGGQVRGWRVGELREAMAKLAGDQ